LLELPLLLEPPALLEPPLAVAPPVLLVPLRLLVPPGPPLLGTLLVSQPMRQSGPAIRARVKNRMLNVIIENFPFCRHEMPRLLRQSYSMHFRCTSPTCEVRGAAGRRLRKSVQCACGLRRRGSPGATAYVKRMALYAVAFGE
jgi:hypothetical protein